MRKDYKWLLRVIFATLLVSFALLLIKIPSYAANEIITAKTHIDVLVAPEEGADVMVSFEKGEPLFVTGIKDGWYSVLFRGETGYFCTQASLKNGIDLDSEEGENVDDAIISDIIAADDSFEEVLASDAVESIDVEFEKGAETSQFVEQETETRARAKKNAIIWGIVIVVLVCAIFVLGIIGTKKENAKKKKKTSSKKNVLDVINLDAEE